VGSILTPGIERLTALTNSVNEGDLRQALRSPATLLDALWLIGAGKIAWRKDAFSLAVALPAVGVVSGAVAIAHVIAISPG